MVVADMNEESLFSFPRYESDIPRGLVRFHYELIHNGKKYTFKEELTFDPSKTSGPLARMLETLHLVLGISYWKLFCPRTIITPYGLSEAQAQFWDTLYTKGLGEFFYRNNIDFRDLVHFPHTQKPATAPISMKLSDRSLVLLGAGKDSIVTAELLKEKGREFTLFTLNPSEIHQEVARQIGRPLRLMKRTLDPMLSELNKHPDAYNGHVPITAVFMCTALFAALLYDFRVVVASNEESANYGNVMYLGSEMNHQWSKSLEFETLLSQYVTNYISQDLSVFSLLRPLTEMDIAKTFSKYPNYFHSFTSCNTNFKIEQNPRRGQWCGKCPKCAFVFLILSAFLPKETVIGIFQKNLFADPTLIATYEELLGIAGFKPFECVGTPEESILAFRKVREKGEFAGDVVYEHIRTER